MGLNSNVGIFTEQMEHVVYGEKQKGENLVHELLKGCLMLLMNHGSET